MRTQAFLLAFKPDCGWFEPSTISIPKVRDIVVKNEPSVTREWHRNFARNVELIGEKCGRIQHRVTRELPNKVGMWIATSFGVREFMHRIRLWEN
jgi:hypothetical protein